MNHRRNLTLAALALLTCIGPLRADLLNYTITFTTMQSLQPETPTGSFSYDPSAGFSNFLVDFGDATFDLTSFANAPALAADPPTGCDAASSSYQYGFLLLNQSVTGCTAGYVWDANYYGNLGYAQFFFILGVEPSQDEIAAAATFPQDIVTPYNVALGTWTITAASPSVPEPASITTMLFGTSVLAAMKIRRRRA
jgi:hypothetical protein